MVDPKYANLLEFTFLHLRGISEVKEKHYWDSGINSIAKLKENHFGSQMSLFEDYYELTQETEAALNQNEVDFFLKKLPRKELYRVALTFFRDVMFLDIETTGLSRHYSYITLIGWTLNGKYKYFIKGDKPELLYEDFAKSKMIVTFNGSIFDIPFIKKEFPKARIPQAHIDLRFFTRRYGYSGGQKEIEERLQIKRPTKIEGIDGREAIVLWYRYLTGDLKSLELLLKYNYYDISGMQQILDKVVDEHIINILPKLIKPIYKFSGDTIDCKIKVTQQAYKRTKNIIKNRTIDEFITQPIDNLKVIGIDLTGSEERASGCCVLQNNVADTCLLKTDKELMEYVLNNKPTVVSIDSPLSLPQGRIKVTDDDPGRHIFGITRYCERELKKRGVNVYPCLIPSMQKLTARGIRLASKLRSLGVTVIESFPGAAQDVLRIPRKRTDMHFLKKGLLDFGICGEFREKDISHDELDAITSALVGLLFWMGRFEAIGNEIEDYLIIPELDNNKQHWGQRKVIGFSGSIATEKTTAALTLKKKGFHYVRFNQVLEELLQEENIEINRLNLQEKVKCINQEHGQYWISKKLFSKIPLNKNVVIDGLRLPEEHAFLTEYCGPDFYHIFIKSDISKSVGINTARGYIDEINVLNMMSLAHLVVDNNIQKDKFELDIWNIIEEQVSSRMV